MDNKYVLSSLSKLKRGTSLILKNDEKVLFVKHHDSMLTVLGLNGLRNISYHEIAVDKMADMYSDEYLYAV